MMPRNGRFTRLTPFGSIPMLACVVPDLFAFTEATSNVGRVFCAQTKVKGTSNAAIGRNGFITAVIPPGAKPRDQSRVRVAQGSMSRANQATTSQTQRRPKRGDEEAWPDTRCTRALGWQEFQESIQPLNPRPAI